MEHRTGSDGYNVGSGGNCGADGGADGGGADNFGACSRASGEASIGGRTKPRCYMRVLMRLMSISIWRQSV